ncbi:MAG: hypothetical protein V4684_01990 [Pseudomonadota bacterium]
MKFDNDTPSDPDVRLEQENAFEAAANDLAARPALPIPRSVGPLAIISNAITFGQTEATFTETLGPGTTANSTPFVKPGTQPILDTTPAFRSLFVQCTTSNYIVPGDYLAIVQAGQATQLIDITTTATPRTSTINVGGVTFMVTVRENSGSRETEITTASGSATHSQFSAVLSSLHFTSTSDDPGFARYFISHLVDTAGARSGSQGLLFNITSVNEAPSLTAATVQGTEDQGVKISYAQLLDATNAQDIDGQIGNLVVKSVNSGTMVVDGQYGAGPYPWAPGLRDYLNSDIPTLTWYPAANQDGPTAAFTVIVKDDEGAESAPVTISVNLAPVNDPPVLTSIAQMPGTVQEQSDVIVDFDMLLGQSVFTDDGGITNFVVTSVKSGTLLMGRNSGGGWIYSPWQAGIHDTIDNFNWARWIAPDVPGTTDAYTLVNAFDVVMVDGSGARSSAAPVQVAVTPLNDPPVLDPNLWSELPARELRPTEITVAQLIEATQVVDHDGTVVAFVVTATQAGTLLIGATPATATAWASGTNDTIDATHRAFWASRLDLIDILPAITVKAKDDDGGLSVAKKIYFETDEAPDLTGFAQPVATGREDTLILISWVNMMIQGDEGAYGDDGPLAIKAFVVTSVNGGTLMIRDSEDRVAAPWVAGKNDVIDLDHSAYWTPPPDGNGVISAFNVVARDSEGDTSVLPVAVKVDVTSVNDKPTFTSMAGPLAVIQEDADAPAQISLVNLKGQGDEADLDGHVVDFVVKSVTSGMLLIGATAATATAWVAGANDTINGVNNAYWSGAANASGTLNAFTVVARDNEGATSASDVLVQVVAATANDAPTMTEAADPFATLAPNTNYPLSLELLRAQTNATDIDGVISAFRITEVASGSLSIRNDDGTFAPWSLNNAVIDLNHPAYWTSGPDPLGEVTAFSITAMDSLGAASNIVPVKFVIAEPNRAPTLTAMAAPVGTVASGLQVEVALDALMAGGNEADADGTVVSYIVTSVTSGSLWIGETADTAQLWKASSNDAIGGGRNAYWTSATGASGQVNAFKVVVKDDDGASSLPPVQVQVTVTLPDSIPTLTSMAAPVVTANEDTLIFISLANLKAQGDEADLNGSVVAFVVKSVTSGTLLIRDSAGNAVPWAAGSNDTIDSTHGAYWKAAPNENGLLDAFTVVAKDNSGLESVTSPVQVQVTVNSINDKPTLSAMAGPVATTDEDTAAVVTLPGLQATANEYDAEGALNTFVVKSVTTGTMLIGTDKTSATPWTAGTNDAITASLHAWWTPAANASGTLNAFTVLAKDDGQLVSSSVQAQVVVRAVNDAPTLTAFSAAVDYALPGGHTQITLAELAAKADEADVEGPVNAFVVRSLSSGSLLIGASAPLATAWAPGVNDLIDASRHAFWTPDLQSTGTVSAFTVAARDSGGAESAVAVQVSLTIAEAGQASSGSALADYLSGGIGDDIVRGLAGNDTLLGLGGDDVLDGGMGTDSLNGGEGSDIYMFLASEHPAAEIFDNGVTGIDEVRFAATTTSTLLLMAGDLGIERVVIGTGNALVADTSGVAGAGINASALGNAVSIFGNAGVNTLTGTAFNDTIDGGPGADVMTGGNGDDTFYVDNSGDRALDSSITGGLDTVIASVSYANAANVEKLVLVGGALNGTGNASANSLVGNANANVLSGLDGHDTIDGAEGNDTLAGGNGNDSLTGGSGADSFRFDTYPNATTNKDTVVDFVSGTDTLQLKVSVFSALGLAGPLTEAMFATGPGVIKGNDTSDRVIYDTSTGTLYYDRDGSASAAPIAIAVIGTDQHPVLSLADFVLV